MMQWDIIAQTVGMAILTYVIGWECGKWHTNRRRQRGRKWLSDNTR